MTAPDPVLAALAAWRAADAAHRTTHARAAAKWPNDPVRAEAVAHRAAWSRRDQALEVLYATCPATLDGLAALAAVFCEEDLDVLLDGSQASRGLVMLLRGVQRIALKDGSRRHLRAAASMHDRPKFGIA